MDYSVVNRCSCIVVDEAEKTRVERCEGMVESRTDTTKAAVSYA